jgi:hypothetical protein
MLDMPFSDGQKAETVAACRESLKHLGFPPTCQVLYIEGTTHDTVRAWKTRKDRRSGDFPLGEWHFDLFPNTIDALKFAISFLQSDPTAIEGILIPAPEKVGATNG